MRWFAGLLIVCLTLGCGGGSGTTQEAPNPAPPPSPMKSVLESIAESGELAGSGMNFSEELAKFKATDPQKAAQIEKDLEGLIKLTDPADIKAKAKQIASGL